LGTQWAPEVSTTPRWRSSRCLRVDAAIAVAGPEALGLRRGERPTTP
jgi:hypothetical protein